MASMPFPVELLHIICRELCGHCQDSQWTPFENTTRAPEPKDEGRQALVNLCRTSSTLRMVAQPYLYHRIRAVHVSTTTLASLARTLVLRPDLAALTTQLALGPAYEDRRPIEGDTALCIGASVRPGQVEGVQAAAELRLDNDGNVDPDQNVMLMALLQIIVAQLPSLEILGLGPNMGQDGDPGRHSCGPWNLFPLIDKVKGPRPQLRRLDVQVSGRDYDLANLAHVFRLAPNLSWVSLIPSVHPIEVSPRLDMTNVRHLSIEDNDVDVDTLLSCCSGLHMFACTFTVNPEGFLAPEAVASLVQHGHAQTLVGLCLVASKMPPFEHDEEEMLPDLSSFARLQRLAVDCRFVLSREDAMEDEDPPRPLRTVPETLRYLQINGPDPRLLDELDFFAHQKAQGKYPHLRQTMICDDNVINAIWAEESMDMRARMFQARMGPREAPILLKPAWAGLKPQEGFSMEDLHRCLAQIS